jgi:hypothetical protein
MTLVNFKKGTPKNLFPECELATEGWPGCDNRAANGIKESH